MEPISNEIQRKEAISYIEKLLAAMGIDTHVEDGVIGDSIAFLIRTNDAALLIGEEGQNLQALNHIIKKALEQKALFPEGQFFVDVNDYQRRRFDELKDKARMGAQRVRYFKKEVTLEPMSAFERRIVHMALQEYPDISTESVGQGVSRKVVIKPLP
ncbi:MAG: R3H domain-containing nucleic acid-binding protein [Patescibacteria group bacterium]